MVRDDPRPPLARTTEDDQMELSLGDRLEHTQYWDQLRKRLFIAVSQYEDQAQDVLYNQLKDGLFHLHGELLYRMFTSQQNLPNAAPHLKSTPGLLSA
ncbi:unnamed protein product [Ranitomeya imitator]|uniref:Uncharacterized protein n=1 Tax=Ranitomeya imitator TaxID=111125 RepID=A0ABN9LEV4_9NEOB|nr:unnamed protein product [Ranitomeya imitator]